MDIGNLSNAQVTAGMAGDDAKMMSLTHKLRNHENKQELQKTAQQFEGVFLKQVLDQMDKTVDRSNSMFSQDSGEETFRGMLYDKIAESIATKPSGSGFGLAEAVYRQLSSQLPKDQQNDQQDNQADQPKTPGTIPSQAVSK